MQCRTPAICGGIPWVRFPVAPILQPELSNPLYLRLVCETLRAKGLDCFPSGWYGNAPAIKAFLEEKEWQFAVDYETSVGANIVRGSLLVIARAIADSGDSVLVWSRAQQVVSQERPQASTLSVLQCADNLTGCRRSEYCYQQLEPGVPQ
jgi:hypothetical protein